MKRIICWAGLWMAAWVLSGTNAEGATVAAGPGDAGFRAAISAAQEGDTVMLTNRVALQSTVRIDKRLTIRFNGSNESRALVSGNFEGELLRLVAAGIVFEWLVFHGSAQTDALRLEAVEGDVVLRDCIIRGSRAPMVDDSYLSAARVRLERVTVEGNARGLFAWNLEAENSIFSRNGDGGVGAVNAHLDNCRMEQNRGHGLALISGAARNCVFGINSGYGLGFDPDGGVLTLSGSLFYANAAGGLFVGEDNYVTVENCTFTRHTGLPAIVVTDAEDVLFRHCTIADNVFIELAPSTHPRLGVFVIQNSGRVELQNCLVADNSTNGSPPTAGLTGDWIDGGGNVIGGSARLSTLRDNGGPTWSLLPLPDSPAIDAGRPSDMVVDARGLSRVAGAAPDAGAIETDASPVADSDADGLPDIWERFHQLNPTNSIDASSDADADGQTALAEFHSHTDPADPQSVLRIEEVVLPQPPRLQPHLRNVRFTWPFMRGVRYQVEVSADLREWRTLLEPGGVFVEDNGRIMMGYGMPVDSPRSFYRVTATGKVTPIP
jgi:hypothetical protein